MEKKLKIKNNNQNHLITFFLLPSLTDGELRENELENSYKHTHLITFTLLSFPTGGKWRKIKREELKP